MEDFITSVFVSYPQSFKFTRFGGQICICNKFLGENHWTRGTRVEAGKQGGHNFSEGSYGLGLGSSGGIK